ncbi:hypothetical protein L6164_015551 [Bauhinia variegata]|uniref:Uncharacterized protein n=1 Tax=Bauhinia variegata TaxID=167791 RepID=A0ACB9NMW9_BAUVA|nr:hypothetical protein L6164_015551 [Bauhinia variegata]
MMPNLTISTTEHLRADAKPRGEKYEAHHLSIRKTDGDRIRKTVEDLVASNCAFSQWRSFKSQSFGYS